MNKEKFKSKSVELCQSALNFSKSLEEAEKLIAEINDPANKDEIEIKNSKMRKLKETFSKLAQYCEDACAESKELNRIPEDGDESIKRKTKIQAKNFSDLNKKVKSMNDSLQSVDALSTVSANSKINFSEVLTSKIASFSVEFGELKEIASDSVESIEETAEKVNEMIEEDKAKKEDPEIGNDSKESEKIEEKSEIKEGEETMNFDEMKEKLSETISEAKEKVEKIEDPVKKAEFAEKIKEIEEMKMDDADSVEQKLEHLEKFSAEFAELENDAKEAACEKCGKSPCECEEIEKKDKQINEAIDEISEKPEAANFSRILKSIKSMKCFSEEDIENKLEATEEVKEKIDEAKEEKAEEPKANVQELAECVDKMEDILSEMNPSEEVKEHFCGIDKAIQNFCDQPSKESKEAIDKSVEEFKESAEKEIKNYSARRCFGKMCKCFAELNETISKSNLPESTVDKLTPPSEVGGTDVKSSVDPDEIKKQNEEIDGILVDAEKAISKIKDPAIKNFASKRVKLISKMTCFSEEDIEEKLSEAEELSEDVKETIEKEAKEETEEKTKKAEFCGNKKSEEVEKASKKNEDDPSKAISDKEAANFSATKDKAFAWGSLYK